MKIAEISCLEYGSTGKIMMSIADVARDNGIEVETFSGSRKNTFNRICPKHHHRFSGIFDYYYHMAIGKFSGQSDFVTHMSSKKLISLLDKMNPDIIHLHITHGCYLNNECLFDYLSYKKIPIVWTMHDCWAITGRCPHFMLSNCSKWRSGLKECKYPLNDYPASRIDRACLLWEKKKELFTKPQKMHIVTPSIWLSNIIKESFLSKYPIQVINNGIDQSIFQPRNSSFREDYSISKNDFIVLGVASSWNNRKGLDVFVQLSKILAKNIRIVLVGTNDNDDKKLPNNIISIHRTEDQIQLAEIYSSADVFVNPTKEDTFPTVNIEALSCGTPVITFDTGGSPEIIDASCGCVVVNNDIKTLVEKIDWICRMHPFSSKDCLLRASKFEKNVCLDKYVDLFNDIYINKTDAFV